ncbi:MAG: phosphatase PAP2 family protein [Oleispira sp.]|nr:phosphatase PAP2 family protein [Oleispira sp.]MBL4882488.1 phosphatase PAP2 family protein [Oleispira sp.]
MQTWLACTLTIITAQTHADISDTAADIGSIGIPLTAGLIALAKDDNEGFIMFLEGAAYTIVATHSLKFAINAERPNGGDYSFPSGHTSSATQGAAYLQFRYGWQYGLPAYIGAGLVGLSRVQNNHHYWRDVIAGAALATAIQYWVTDPYESNLVITPSISEADIGINGRWTF